MAVPDEFVDYVVEQISGWGEVSVRRMFGRAGLYREGTMFAVVADDVAYLKVDDSNRDDFLRAGSAPFEPYPDKIKTAIRDYFEIPPLCWKTRTNWPDGPSGPGSSLDERNRIWCSLWRRYFDALRAVFVFRGFGIVVINARRTVLTDSDGERLPRYPDRGSQREGPCECVRRSGLDALPCDSRSDTRDTCHPTPYCADLVKGAFFILVTFFPCGLPHADNADCIPTFGETNKQESIA